MKKNHYVFVTSNRNESRIDVRLARNRYTDSGIKNTLLETHSTLTEDVRLSSSKVLELIDYLDSDTSEE